MPIYAEAQPTTSHEPAPAGNHFARCVAMIDMGTQANKFDPSKPAQRKVRITFELPDERREFKAGEGEKPHLVSKKFTLSMHEKSTLRPFLQAWRGRPFTDEQAQKFDVSVLLGKACLLNIIHETKGEKTYANISSVGPLVKGMPEAAQVTPSLEFSLAPADFRQELYDALPEFLRTEIADSPEYQKLQQPGQPPRPLAAAPDPSAPMPDDDPLPF